MPANAKATGVPFRPGSWAGAGLNPGDPYPLPPGYDDGFANMEQFLDGSTPAGDITDKLTKLTKPSYVNNMCYLFNTLEALRFPVDLQAGGYTIEHQGTATLGFAGDLVGPFAPGTAWDIIIKEPGGAVYAHVTCTDYSATIAFDSSGNGNHAEKLLEGTPVDTFHSYSDDAPPYNIMRGYRNIPTTIIQTLEGPSPDGRTVGQTFGTEPVTLVESNAKRSFGTSPTQNMYIGSETHDYGYTPDQHLWCILSAEPVSQAGTVFSRRGLDNNVHDGYWDVYNSGGTHYFRFVMRNDDNASNSIAQVAIPTDTPLECEGWYDRVNTKIVVRARPVGDTVWTTVETLGVNQVQPKRSTMSTIMCQRLESPTQATFPFDGWIAHLKVMDYALGTTLIDLPFSTGGNQLYDAQSGVVWPVGSAIEDVTQDVYHYNYVKGCSVGGQIVGNTTTDGTFVSTGVAVNNDDFEITTQFGQHSVLNTRVPVGCASNAGQDRTFFWINNDEVRFYYGDSATILTYLNHSHGNIYRVVKNATNVELWVNGILEDSMATGAKVGSTVPLAIGANARDDVSEGTSHFDGLVQFVDISINGVPQRKMRFNGDTWMDLLTGTRYLPTGVREVTQFNVPARDDGTADALGNTILNPAGVTHPGCETKVLQSTVINPIPNPASYRELVDEDSNRVARIVDTGLDNRPITKINVYDEGGEDDGIIPARLDGTAAANDLPITRPPGYLHNATRGSDILQVDPYFLTQPNWYTNLAGDTIEPRSYMDHHDHGNGGGPNLWMRWKYLTSAGGTGGVSAGCMLEETGQYAFDYVLSTGEVWRANGYFKWCNIEDGEVEFEYDADLSININQDGSYEFVQVI